METSILLGESKKSASTSPTTYIVIKHALARATIDSTRHHALPFGISSRYFSILMRLQKCSSSERFELDNAIYILISVSVAILLAASRIFVPNKSIKARGIIKSDFAFLLSYKKKRHPSEKITKNAATAHVLHPSRQPSRIKKNSRCIEKENRCNKERVVIGVADLSNAVRNSKMLAIKGKGSDVGVKIYEKRMSKIGWSANQLQKETTPVRMCKGNPQRSLPRRLVSASTQARFRLFVFQPVL